MSSIKKNYIYNLIYQIIAIITPIITTPYVSRVLGAAGIGKYSYHLSIVTYFGIFGTLGLNTYAQLEIAKRRNDDKKCTKIISELIAVRSITLIISILLYLILIIIDRSNYQIMLTLLIYLFAQLLDFSWILQGLENFKSLVLRNVIVKLISIFLIFSLVKTSSDLYIYSLIMQGSVLIGNILIYKYVKKYINIKEIEKINILKHLKRSMVYFIPTIASSIYMVLDKSMIGWFTNSDIQNGFYEQSHKIEQILVTIVTSISMVTLPRMTYLNENKNKEKFDQIMDKTIKFVLMISIPMSFGLIAVSYNLIPLFLGSEYIECIVLVQFFSILIVVIGLSNAFGKQSLMATGKQKEYNVSIIIGSVINLTLNLILIPKYASLGATISSVIAEISILILFIYYSKDILKISIKAPLIKYFTSSLLMFIVIFCIRNIFASALTNLILQVIIGIMLYFLLLLILKDSLFIEIIQILLNKISNNKESKEK